MRIIAFYTIFFVFHTKGYSKDHIENEETEPKEVLLGDLIQEGTLNGGLLHSFEHQTGNVLRDELLDGNTFLEIPPLNNSKGVPNQNTESSHAQENYVQNITTDAISDGKFPSMDIFAFSPVFAPTSGKVQTEDCRRHSQIFLHQLKKYKLWALQMHDSSAKLPSGILRGNANQLGDFDQCLSVTGSDPSTPTDMIRGQYCLASIDISATPHAMSGKESLETPVHWAQSMELIKSSRLDSGHGVPQFSTIKWGLCVPHSCTPGDVDASLKDALRQFGTSLTGFQIETQVDSDMCYDVQPTELSAGTFIAISMFSAVIAVALIATLRDDGTAVQLRSRGKLEKTLMAFSIKKTLSKLLRAEQGDRDLQCINGIRALCTILLYGTHKFMSMAFIPYTNRINLAQLGQYPVFMLLRAFAIYVYAFLLLSGVLTAYNMSREMKRKGYVDWKRRYLARFIRLTPALISLVVYFAYIGEHLGNGPMWNKVVKRNADLCKVSMWRNMFYIHNFYPFEEMCAPNTHSLAVDMQLSLVAPLLVYLLFVSQGWGILLLVTLQVIPIALRYNVSVQNNLSLLLYSGITLNQIYRTFNMTYILASHQATPYMFGIGLGYFLNKINSKIHIPKYLVYGGWLSATYLIYLCFFSMSEVVSSEYQYDAVKMSIYYALSPVALSLALCWVILACVTGHGGWLNSALCWRGLTIFSKISYSVYLTQFLVFFYNVGTTKTSQEFNAFTGYVSLFEFIFVLLASTIMTLLFDLPMQEVKNILLDTNCYPLYPGGSARGLKKTYRIEDN